MASRIQTDGVVRLVTALIDGAGRLDILAVIAAVTDELLVPRCGCLATVTAGLVVTKRHPTATRWDWTGDVLDQATPGTADFQYPDSCVFVSNGTGVSRGPQ